MGRWGGEEFCVLLADCRGDALQAGERLRSAVPGGQTCSVSVACWDGREDVQGLVARADAALHQAKRGGRDRTILAA